MGELFEEFFEISCLAMALTISVETSWFFGGRVLQQCRSVIAWTGLLPSLLTVVYTATELIYYYVSVGRHNTNCTAFKVWITMRSVSNGLAFVHLFLRAEAVNNSFKHHHWPRWRAAGAALLAANFATLLAVAFTRDAQPREDELFGTRCYFSYDSVALVAKWALQLACHLAFAAAFCWPLLGHMRALRAARVAHAAAMAAARAAAAAAGGSRGGSGGGTWAAKRANIMAASDAACCDGGGLTGSSRGDAVYRSLVTRAVVAMAASSVFTIVVTVLTLLDIAGVLTDVPLVSLGIADNALLLGSIYFANSGRLGRGVTVMLSSFPHGGSAAATAGASAGASGGRAAAMEAAVLTPWPTPKLSHDAAPVQHAPAAGSSAAAGAASTGAQPNAGMTVRWHAWMPSPLARGGDGRRGEAAAAAAASDVASHGSSSGGAAVAMPFARMRTAVMPADSGADGSEPPV